LSLCPVACLRINVEREAAAGMPHQFLNHLHILAIRDQERRIRMSEGVPADSLLDSSSQSSQSRRLNNFQQCFILIGNGFTYTFVCFIKWFASGYGFSRTGQSRQDKEVRPLSTHRKTYFAATATSDAWRWTIFQASPTRCSTMVRRLTMPGRSSKWNVAMAMSPKRWMWRSCGCKSM
jgi:hypothetical protein